jgi:hypothetical protein
MKRKADDYKIATADRSYGKGKPMKRSESQAGSREMVAIVEEAADNHRAKMKYLHLVEDNTEDVKKTIQRLKTNGMVKFDAKKPCSFDEYQIEGKQQCIDRQKVMSEYLGKLKSMVDTQLADKLKGIEGRLPSVDEIKTHAKCVVSNCRRKELYIWKKQPILEVCYREFKVTEL